MNRSPEWKAAQSKKLKAYWAKKHAADCVKAQAVAHTDTEVTDYKKLYMAEVAKNKTLENKVAEYENICKSYATRVQNAENALKSATLEYNARIKYMLDCSKHAYISMQFAAESKGDK